MFLKQRKCKKNVNIKSKMYNKIWSWNVSYLVLCYNGLYVLYCSCFFLIEVVICLTCTVGKNIIRER